MKHVCLHASAAYVPSSVGTCNTFQAAFRRYFSFKLRAAMAEWVITLKYLHGQGSSAISAPKVAKKGGIHLKFRNDRSQSSLYDLILTIAALILFMHSMIAVCCYKCQDMSRLAAKTRIQRWAESCSKSSGARCTGELSQDTISNSIHSHAPRKAPKHSMFADKTARSDPLKLQFHMLKTAASC